MPNWCDNRLTVRGDEEDVYRWVEKAAAFDNPGGDHQPLNFEAFIRPPKTVKDNGQLIDWRYSNWGTKWEPSIIDFTRKEGSAEYRFETAWAPPAQWLITVAKEHPELEFSISYAEPGMDFAGEMVLQGGEIILEEETTAEDYYC